MNLPPTGLRERVAGTSDEPWFLASGARTVDEWHRALESAGLRLGDFPVVLDFGCGCGRALRHLAVQVSPGQKLYAVDTDPEAIAWVGENIPGVTAKALEELPPTPLPDRSVDLILSHSVFTHLTEQVQFRWLTDLARILRPGGVLVASFHGKKVINEYCQSMGTIVPAETITAIRSLMEAHGFYHAALRTEAEKSFPEYYGAAFHTVEYIAREWTKYFDILGWHPTFALDHQDVLVLRVKKAD